MSLFVCAPVDAMQTANAIVAVLTALLLENVPDASSGCAPAPAPSDVSASMPHLPDPIGVFIGEKARTIDRITPGEPGYVRFKGEYWQARSDTTIEQDTKVVIVDKDESVLIVKPKER